MTVNELITKLQDLTDGEKETQIVLVSREGDVQTISNVTSLNAMGSGPIVVVLGNSPDG